MFDGVCCVGAGEGNADASGGIILQNQTHHLADHRIIINHADGDRLLVMVAFGAHPTHGSRTSRWKTLCWSKPYWHVPPACCMRLAKPGRPAPFLVSAICEGDCGIVGLLTCTCTLAGGSHRPATTPERQAHACAHWSIPPVPRDTQSRRWTHLTAPAVERRSTYQSAYSRHGRRQSTAAMSHGSTTLRHHSQSTAGEHPPDDEACQSHYAPHPTRRRPACGYPR